jgi:small conductance mechanosensitive channel
MLDGFLMSPYTKGYMEESTASRIIDWISLHGFQIVAIVFALWLAQRFTTAIVSRIVRRAMRREGFSTKREAKQREDTLVGIISTAVKVAAWLMGFMLIAQNIGIEIGPLLAGASIAGVALGFGTQSLVKDLLSGLFIIIENQYRVGDIVTIAGVSGQVQIINMRQTVLRDLDGNVHHIPNGLVEVATNMSSEFSRINLNVGVSYDTDIDKAEKVINEVGAALAADPKWESSIELAPKFERIDAFNENSVTLKILGQVKSAKQWDVAGELRRRIKKAFDKNGIEIPFPQVVVHQKRTK